MKKVLWCLVLFYRAFILSIMIIREIGGVFMGVNYLTDEQLSLSEENPYVIKA